MNATLTREVSRPLTLKAVTAAELMSSNPVSLRADATVPEALALLTTREFSAAPVIDDAGRPLGVLSQSDLLVHQREQLKKSSGPFSELPAKDPEARAGEVVCVRDLMTPVVFAVAPQMPAGKVVEQMLALKVHRLFVVDDAGVLIGTISALDVLRHLA